MNYLCNLFIILLKWLAILSIKESSNTHYFFLFVNNWKWKHIFDFPASLIYGLFLKMTNVCVQFHSEINPVRVKNLSLIILYLTWKVKYSSAGAFIILQICQERSLLMEIYLTARNKKKYRREKGKILQSHFQQHMLEDHWQVPSDLLVDLYNTQKRQKIT